MNLNLDKSAWKRVRLGDVVQRSRKQADPAEAGIERYVAGGHIDSDSMVIQRWGDVCDGQMGSTFRYVFEPGQILFVSARPYLRKTGVVGFSGVVADKTYVLDADPGNGLLQDFLPWVLSSDSFIEYATAEATGSMNPRLLWGPFQRYEFELPSLDEQKRIADLLWSLERHRTTIAAAGKLSGDLQLQVLDEWLESVSNWSRIGDQFEVQLGKMLSGASSPSEDDPGLPYLANINVRWNDFDLSELRLVRLNEREKEKFRLNPGDLLVCEGGDVGRAAIWDGRLEECYYQKALHRLRPRSGNAIPGKVLVAYLKLMSYRGQLNQHSTGTTFSHLTRERLIELEIPDLSAKEAEVLLNFLRACETVLSDLTYEVVALRNLRSSLFAHIF